MIWLLALALAQTRAEVAALAEKLPRSHAELVKLGPPALRFLCELPSRPAVKDAMFEIKTDARSREKLSRELTLRTVEFPLAEIDERVGAFLETPFVVDLGLAPEKRNRRIAFAPGKFDAVLRSFLEPAGLDYAVVRGRILVSTPDRLWSYPPDRVRVLSPEESAALKESIAKLGDESVQARDDAAAAILDAGVSAVPFLEEALRAPGLEGDRRARIVDLVRRIQARRAPAPFASGLVLERQKANDLDRIALEALRERKTRLTIESTLEGAVALVARAAALEADVPRPAADRRVGVTLGDMPVLDALYFLLASFDLDAALVNGRLTVGPTAEVEKRAATK